MLEQPKIAYFLTIVDREGNLVTSGLVRVIPSNVSGYDDTPDRLALMATFASRLIGDTCPLQSPHQVWAFWENHALPSGYRLVAIEPAAHQGVAQPFDLYSEPPAPAEEPPAVTPTHLEGGHA